MRGRSISRRVWLCGALVVALLPAAPAPSLASASVKPRVVVAVIDSAPNPYHEFFHEGGPLYKKSTPSSVTPEVLKEFGIDKDHVIRVTRTGNFELDFKKDKARFDAIEEGEPYWFAGTNIIGVSFNEAKQRLRPDTGDSSHGVGTGAAVLIANPEAIIVMVESPGVGTEVPGYATRPIGEAWAFNHPSVDIVSTSYGPPFSPPLMYHLTNSYKGVVENGKLHFGAADNSPALSPVDATSGPWWTIGVAGYDEGNTEGRSVESGSLPDFVGDWTQILPYCRRCEKEDEDVHSGTSFSTPRSAGVASKILLEARRAAHHSGGIVTKGVDSPLMVASSKDGITNWQLRRALEEAAYYPALSDYQPGVTGVPIVEQAPWAETGWGLITPDPKLNIVGEALAHLGVAGKPKRAKDDAACAFMTANMDLRKHFWNNAYFSESRGTSAYPYIAC